MRYFDAVTFERIANCPAVAAELLGELVARSAVPVSFANCSNFEIRESFLLLSDGLILRRIHLFALMIRQRQIKLLQCLDRIMASILL